MNTDVLVMIILIIVLFCLIVFLWIGGIRLVRDVNKLTAVFSSEKNMLDKINEYNHLLNGLRKDVQWFDMDGKDYGYRLIDYTPDVLFNSVLSYEQHKAQEQGIDVNVECDDSGNMDWFMSDSDTVALISNLMDNAIEGASDCDKPFINVKLRCSDHIEIDIINSKTGNRIWDDKRKIYMTNKEKSAEHGFGIPVIREILDEYRGDSQFADYGDTFKVSISIPLTEVNT